MIKLLVELKHLPRKYLIFYNENQLLHQLLIKMITSEFFYSIVVNHNLVKLILILIILL